MEAQRLTVQDKKSFACCSDRRSRTNCRSGSRGDRMRAHGTISIAINVELGAGNACYVATRPRGGLAGLKVGAAVEGPIVY
jgi:hypothetical protein